MTSIPKAQEGREGWGVDGVMRDEALAETATQLAQYAGVGLKPGDVLFSQREPETFCV